MAGRQADHLPREPPAAQPLLVIPHLATPPWGAGWGGAVRVRAGVLQRHCGCHSGQECPTHRCMLLRNEPVYLSYTPACSAQRRRASQTKWAGACRMPEAQLLATRPPRLPLKCCATPAAGCCCMLTAAACSLHPLPLPGPQQSCCRRALPSTAPPPPPPPPACACRPRRRRARPHARHRLAGAACPRRPPPPRPAPPPAHSGSSGSWSSSRRSLAGLLCPLCAGITFAQAGRCLLHALPRAQPGAASNCKWSGVYATLAFHCVAAKWSSS